MGAVAGKAATSFDRGRAKRVISSASLLELESKPTVKRGVGVEVVSVANERSARREFYGAVISYHFIR